MTKVNVGFTGTQRGTTKLQYQTVTALLRSLNVETFHHGDCIGADEQIARFVHTLGYPIVVHPPLNEAKRAHVEFHSRTLPPRDYLDRNHDIVDSTDLMVATPGEMSERIRSGTWATIRYAAKRQKDVLIVYPDGSLEPRRIWVPTPIRAARS
jgi:hypothetical protein